MRRSNGDGTRRRLGILAILLLAVGPARAQDPDEMRDVRVTKSGGSIVLDWSDPAVPPDSHVIRRCTLAALRGGMFGAPYFGNCVGRGVAGTTWTEPTPPGNVFYLVSGVTAGAEGSLGNSWNGRSLVPRPPTDCDNPETAQPLTLVISVTAPILVCGSQVIVTFPPEDLVFVSGICSGIQDGWLGATNGTVPGIVREACAGITGAMGPGEIMRMEFQRGDCPVSVDAFRLAQCQVASGPTCSSPANSDVICELDIQ